MRISDWSSDVCSSDLLPEEGVTLHARSRDMVGFIVAGPKSRELLARLTDEDVSNAGFPFMDFRRMDLGMVPAWVGRINFTGDLGYELWVAPEIGRAACRERVCQYV